MNNNYISREEVDLLFIHMEKVYNEKIKQLLKKIEKLETIIQHINPEEFEIIKISTDHFYNDFEES